MKTWKICIAYPFYFTVQADTQEMAENQALENAKGLVGIVRAHSAIVEPVVHDIEDITPTFEDRLAKDN
jgi:hypothetical protein